VFTSKPIKSIKSYLLNSGSHEAGLITSKLHSYTNYKTLDMQIVVKDKTLHPQLRLKVS